MPWLDLRTSPSYKQYSQHRYALALASCIPTLPWAPTNHIPGPAPTTSLRFLLQLGQLPESGRPTCSSRLYTQHHCLKVDISGVSRRPQNDIVSTALRLLIPHRNPRYLIDSIALPNFSLSAHLQMQCCLMRLRLPRRSTLCSMRSAHIPYSSSIIVSTRNPLHLPRRALSSMSGSPHELFNYTSGLWL